MDSYNKVRDCAAVRPQAPLSLPNPNSRSLPHRHSPLLDFSLTWPVDGSGGPPNVNLSLRWNFSLPSRLGYWCGGGLISDSGGRLYFTCGPLLEKTYNIYCLDGATGSLRWQSQFKEPYYSTHGWTPALSDDERLVFVRSSTLQAFDANNGSLVWQQPFAVTGGSLRVAPVVRGDVLYVNGMGGVQAYQASTGALLWQSAAISNTGPVSSSVTPVLTPSGKVVLTAVQQVFNASRDYGPNPRLHLLAASAATGATMWRWNVSLVLDQMGLNSYQRYVQYGMSHAVDGRELFYLSVFPYGLVVVDALDGSVLSWGQHSATLQSVNDSPVLWPASAPNNPYGQTAVLNSCKLASAIGRVDRGLHANTNCPPPR